MGDKVSSQGSGTRPVQVNSPQQVTAPKQTQAAQTAQAAKPRSPLDVFAGVVRNVVQQPAAQNLLNTGVRMMFGVNAGALAQTLQAMVAGKMSPAQASAAAQADVGALMKRNPNPDASDVVTLLVQHPGDPEYAAAVIGALPDEVKQGPLLMEENRVTGIGGHDGQQLLDSAMKLARDHQPPLLNMDVLRQSPAYTSDLDQRMDAIADPAATLRDKATNSVEVQAVAVSTLSATSQAAHDKLKDLDSQLSRELARFGPAMTQTQKDAFIAAYKQEHPEYGVADAADSALAACVQGNQATLQKAALDPSNPLAGTAATALANAYQGLAGTKFNQTVVDALKVPGLQPQLAMYHPEGATGFYDKVVTPASEQLMASAALSGNPQSIVQDLQTIYSNMGSVAQLADQSRTGLQSFGKLGAALAELGKSGDGKAFGEALKSISDEAGNTSSVGKLVAAGGFAMGVAMIVDGVGRGGSAGRDEAMKGMMGALQGSPAIGYGLEMLSTRFPTAISADLAKGVTGVLEKASAFLGMVSSGLSFLDDMSKAAGGDASNGQKMQIFSDFLGMVGGAAVLLGANVFGVVAGVAALGTAAISQWLQGQEQADKNRLADDDAWKLLTDPKLQPPVDGDLLNTLKNLPEGAAQALTSQMGLTPDQWVTYAKRYPNGLAQMANAAVDPAGTGAQRLRQLTGDLKMSTEQLLQLGQTNPQVLGSLTAQDDTFLRAFAGFQNQLGLSPERSFQLMNQLASTTPPDTLDSVMSDIATLAYPYAVPGDDARSQIQKLRDLNASVDPQWTAAMDLILQAK